MGMNVVLAITALTGFSVGCLISTLIAIYYFNQQQKKVEARITNRHSVISAIGKHVAFVENAHSAYKLGTMQYDALRNIMVTKCQEVTDVLNSNLDLLDAFYVRYIERFIDDQMAYIGQEQNDQSYAPAYTAGPTTNFDMAAASAVTPQNYFTGTYDSQLNVQQNMFAPPVPPPTTAVPIIERDMNQMQPHRFNIDNTLDESSLNTASQFFTDQAYTSQQNYTTTQPAYAFDTTPQMQPPLIQTPVDQPPSEQQHAAQDVEQVEQQVEMISEIQSPQQQDIYSQSLQNVQTIQSPQSMESESPFIEQTYVEQSQENQGGFSFDTFTQPKDNQGTAEQEVVTATFNLSTPSTASQTYVPKDQLPPLQTQQEIETYKAGESENEFAEEKTMELTDILAQARAMKDEEKIQPAVPEFSLQQTETQPQAQMQNFEEAFNRGVASEDGEEQLNLEDLSVEEPAAEQDLEILSAEGESFEEDEPIKGMPVFDTSIDISATQELNVREFVEKAKSSSSSESAGKSRDNRDKKSAESEDAIEQLKTELSETDKNTQQIGASENNLITGNDVMEKLDKFFGFKKN
ncbi:MAG: hypothetical protein JW795_06855 [Chitinivibrionales bacterium]|nr:hypothetical protein [Chitinivibrionales bacterium]